ncbi:MAG: hypothetical protein FWD17_08340 [Polyangiaceae bacterium]|nr:hypothetical protein [Polyangiaceae bacterium]
MSASRNRDPARGFEHAERLIDEEADRLAAMSDGDFDGAMAAEAAPARVPSVAELMQRGERRERDRARTVERIAVPALALGAIPDARPRPRPRARWVAATAAAGIAALVALWAGKRADLLAPLGRPRVTAGEGDPAAESVSRQAAAIREDALHACAAGDFARCKARLDEAGRLEPAGEADLRVVEARREIAGAEGE